MIEVIKLKMLRCDALGCPSILVEHHFDAGQGIKHFRAMARDHGWTLNTKGEALCEPHSIHSSKGKE